MSRTVLFRGKTERDGMWIKGGALERVNGRVMILLPKSMRLAGIYVDPKTVGMYTGKDDLNDNPIFEGDIVSFTDGRSTESGYTEEGCIGEVSWSDKYAQFLVSNRLSAESWEALDECLVIGNIFDNPELLEGDTLD